MTTNNGDIPKTNIPFITEETIREVGLEAAQDNTRLFHLVAISNPDFYRFVYEMYNLPNTNKSTMLGLLVAMYHVIDRQLEKGKKNRKRLKHNDNTNLE